MKQNKFIYIVRIDHDWVAEPGDRHEDLYPFFDLDEAERFFEKIAVKLNKADKFEHDTGLLFQYWSEEDRVFTIEKYPIYADYYEALKSTSQT